MQESSDIDIQPSFCQTPVMRSGGEYVISFSGGRTSAFMTLELLKDAAYQNSAIIFANTGKEREETLIYVHEVDKLIGGKIVWVEYRNNEQGFEVVDFETASRKGEPFRELILKRKFCPNVMARFCTQELKIRPMKKYCQKVLCWKHWTNLVGIRYDEPRRYNKTKSVTRSEVFEVEHPLVKWRISKQDVLNYWQKMPFDLQLKDHEGNCDVCFLKGKKKKQQIARDYPELFDWWIEMEQEIKGQFVKGYSYEDLRQWVISQPQFQFDDSIDCFCNVD